MGEIRTALGLMSGTSMDGIDIALLRTDGESIVHHGPSGYFPYDQQLRATWQKALVTAKAIRQRDERPDDLGEVERKLTLAHAAAVKSFLHRHGLSAQNIDLIGFHGQTVLHRPDDALTVQIGDGPLLAEEVAIDVVYDMRANDMVHGGQGAPLIPIYHAALAANLPKQFEKPAVFVNIGGISNLTYIGESGTLAAFDSGPGNMLIDQWIEAHTGKAYDKGGATAARGAVVPSLVSRYMESPFFSANIRRSLDRSDFMPPAKGEVSLEDGARTLAHLTGAAIIKSASYLPEGAKTYVVCGGGRLNPVIIAEFAEQAAKLGAKVIAAEEAGFDGGAMEAEAWAYLAVRSLRGLPLTYPGTTGVKEPVTGGVFVQHGKG
ncbi:anhydro-N-acetylmuramic acid kinase [Agrobacterium rubi TR3 = NBRC 13261]|uniref:Anhydro-N-acetylmuramic acid kinase n=1 Tax=Agrobacterium rubi TR3 = NBRC 13261 TaxID=1368415 RepID=A0A081CRU7_9HYPH|nr:anhydro-N-acetylmuramic acid kinase [Agrobacterium rubi]MBP1876796.1 anhydro-N-acetylmuramic acid kinase [Agrobacterium rubi]MCL6650991.1 anhydro-N-acetylmuramic acid kinase [Agrobacterium rubi]GAK69393.1 anhydro-N-acetylmuramic acid kinase [Agrobacterium rubi TR3 = NBRC 13261]